MLARRLGFAASWKMLRLQKGWVKPLLILTLVGWIPILGQMVVLGYAFEWARLTAWGADTAPKQHGIDFSKLIKTGAICWLVMFTLRLVWVVVAKALFGGTSLAWMPMGMVLDLGDLISGRFPLDTESLVEGLVDQLLAAFVMCAMMRATVYDDFAAGWRLDRLFQMIARDAGGFARMYLSVLLAAFVAWAYWFVLSVVCTSLLIVMGVAAYLSGSFAADITDIVHLMAQIGPLSLLGWSVVAVLAVFAGGVVGTAMQLLGINVVGQWFCRFDVARWGVSSAPLPDGVPVRAAAAEAGEGSE